MKHSWIVIAMLFALYASSLIGSAQTPTPANSPAGKWQVTMVPNAPWVFEFTVDGTNLLGTIRQSGAANDPVTITDGKISGTTLSFKVKSPDGVRTITFTGRVNGNEISFVRQIAIPAAGSRGGNDLFGALAALQFVAQRARQ
jgi:hypothetical protein